MGPEGRKGRFIDPDASPLHTFVPERAKTFGTRESGSLVKKTVNNNWATELTSQNKDEIHLGGGAIPISVRCWLDCRRVSFIVDKLRIHLSSNGPAEY